MPQIPVRGSNLMGKLAQAESLKSARQRRLSGEKSAQDLQTVRGLTQKAISGDKESLSQISGYDMDEYKKVSDAVNKMSDREREKKMRNLTAITSILSHARTPEEWDSTLNNAMLHGNDFIDPKAAQGMMGKFDQRDMFFSRAEGFKEILKRKQSGLEEERKYESERLRDERKHEMTMKEKGLSKKHPYPNEDDINTANAYIEKYRPGLEGSDKMMAAIQIATEINKGLENEVDYAQAATTAIQNVLGDIEGGEENPPQFFKPWTWRNEGPGTYTPQSPPSASDNQEKGQTYRIDGQDVSILEEDPQRGVKVRDANGRVGWIKTNLEGLYRYLNR